MKYDKYKITKGRNIEAKYNKNLYSYALEYHRIGRARKDNE